MTLMHLKIRVLPDHLNYQPIESFNIATIIYSYINYAYGLKNSLTSTTGSHAKLLSDDASSAMPVGGPRKLSQTSRNRDSSASLQIFHHNFRLVC